MADENSQSGPVSQPTSPIPEPTDMMQKTPIEPIETTIPTDQVTPETPAGTAQAEEETAHLPVNEPLTAETLPAHDQASTPPQTTNQEPQSQEINRASLEPSLPQNNSFSAQEFRLKSVAKRNERKRKKLDRILALLAEKENITNDDVEKLLHVSDATATRYLNQLEKEGKITQIGKTGRGIFYRKI